MELYATTTAAKIARASHKVGPAPVPQPESTTTANNSTNKKLVDVRPEKFEVLEFWAQQEVTMPALSAVARAEFSAEATEASSERFVAVAAAAEVQHSLLL
jgi:hypothetical protein